MKSVIRRRTSGRSSRGTTTRIWFSPRPRANSSTSNAGSRAMRPMERGAGAAGGAGGGEAGAAGAAAAGRGGTGAPAGRGPAGARSGDLGGYLARTGDPSRPTNPPEGRDRRRGRDRAAAGDRRVGRRRWGAIGRGNRGGVKGPSTGPRGRNCRICRDNDHAKLRHRWSILSPSGRQTIYVPRRG